MRDYWLSKFFYDVQGAAAEYRADRAAMIARYPLKPAVKAAILADDVGTLARHVNPYLLRFYFAASGMKDDEFIRRLRATAGGGAEARHG